MGLQRHLVRHIGKRDAVRAEPVGVGRVRLRVYGQHAVDHRCARGFVARILVIEEVASEDVEPRLVHRVRCRLDRPILLDHRDIAEVPVIGDDLLAHRRERHRHAARSRRPSGRKYLSRILEIILDKVRSTTTVTDGCCLASSSGLTNGLIPLGEHILIAFLHELP